MTSIENFSNISKEKIKQISKKDDEMVSQKTRKLEESEFKYRTIFNASPDIIYVTDYYGNVLDANQAWMNIIGVKREDFDKINITDFYVGNNTEDLRKYIQEIRNGKEVKGIEIKAKNIAGVLFDFEINSLPVEKDGRILMVINIARDITKRKEIERKLRDSEENYRLISESANDLIRVMNDKFEFDYINEKVHKRLLGYSKEDMLGKMSLVFIHPQDRRSVIRSTRNYLRGEKRSYEARFRSKSGDYKWFEMKAKVFYDDRGDMKILSIARDINDRKLAELKLNESEEKYRLISENAHDLISILNHKFKYEYINENAFIQILGHSKDDLIGKSALKFIHPDDLSLGTKSLLEGFKNGIGVAELRYRHKNGNLIWIETKGQTFTNANGDLKAILVSRDVTERKLNEQKTQESERRFRQLYNQLSFYKDLFAHDISNILHVIRSSTELLSLQLSEQKSKEIEELVNIIDKQIERGTKLMSNAFTLSELEESEISIKTLKLCDVLSDSIEYFRKTHEEKNVKIEVQCKKANEEILVKASYLLQDIFDNILNNAIIYNTSPQVEILISLSSERIEDVNYLKIEFKDNGIGISDDKKQLVFERGNRELKGSKGMGLGLSIVKKILDSYQGKIWVEDRVKGNFTKGTNFVLILREIE
jgi:PAS domain S-box-containing protein